MNDYNALIGTKVGKWLIIKEISKNKYGQKRMKCVCECGSVENRLAYQLLKSLTHACEKCNTIDRTNLQTKHGASIIGKKKPEYNSWMCMKTRCFNINDPQHCDYGGRGITVCDRWLGENGFSNFFADMGLIPIKGYTIERRDNDGNYEPSNCYWASKPTQSRNRRNNKYLEYNGERLVQRDWANRLGVHETTIHYQLKLGKTFSQVMEYLKNKKIAA